MSSVSRAFAPDCAEAAHTAIPKLHPVRPRQHGSQIEDVEGGRWGDEDMLIDSNLPDRLWKGGGYTPLDEP